jgi:hypothetical protein
MSDIQSISQNNYILATQQEVSHDNTLSGNGTVDSPLGVVPGYNETVLFSAATPYDKNRTSITLSESYKNFDELKIYWAHHIGTQFTEQITYSDTQDANDFMCIGGRGSNANQITHFEAAWSAVNNTSLTAVACIFSTVQAGTSISWANSNELMPYKVIGINRKA